MLEDALVSGAYREHLADVLVRRCLQTAAERAGRGGP
jgi:CO/xanthine dehydrogenase FAD-binding subunit